MPTVNTVVRNKYQTQTESTQYENLEKYSPCWATLSTLSRTMVHHLHQANLANSAISMESVISDLPRIILQRTERLNASSKCSNVRFVRILTLPRTVHLLPQPANSIQSPKFIVFSKDSVPYPHSTTGRTPSELLFERTIRTTLDLIRPQVQRQVTGYQLR